MTQISFRKMIIINNQIDLQHWHGRKWWRKDLGWTEFVNRFPSSRHCVGPALSCIQITFKDKLLAVTVTLFFHMKIFTSNRIIWCYFFNIFSWGQFKKTSRKGNDGLVHIWGNPDPHWGPNSVYDIRIHLAYFILNGNGTGSEPLICCPLRNNFLKYLIIFWVCYSLMLSTWPSNILVVKKRFLNNKRYVGGNVRCWYMKRELHIRVIWMLRDTWMLYMNATFRSNCNNLPNGPTC